MSRRSVSKCPATWILFLSKTRCIAKPLWRFLRGAAILDASKAPTTLLFCAHFVNLLHVNNAKGFSAVFSIDFFDALLSTLPKCLFGMTKEEAACSSILLNETWIVVSRWRYDETSFSSELSGTTGSHVKADGDVEAQEITKEGYRKLYNRWHAMIGACSHLLIAARELAFRRLSWRGGLVPRFCSGKPWPLVW